MSSRRVVSIVRPRRGSSRKVPIPATHGAAPSAWKTWTADPGAYGVMLIIPLSIFFPLGWGVHSMTKNWDTDFRFDKGNRKSFTRGNELRPEISGHHPS